jgi:hypothetical protein
MREERETPSAMTRVCHGVLPCDCPQFESKLKTSPEKSYIVYISFIYRPFLETPMRLKVLGF